MGPSTSSAHRCKAVAQCRALTPPPYGWGEEYARLDAGVARQLEAPPGPSPARLAGEPASGGPGDGGGSHTGVAPCAT